MSKGTFFNRIGIADMERVHSAIIGWMLSDECEAFCISVRSELLIKLFGYNANRIFTKIESLIEWKNIDILFFTEDNTGHKDCWVIENKIKASQHSNQLMKYVEIVNQDYPDCQKHFAYLTLIGETALCNTDEWKNITYQQLEFFLQNNVQKLRDNTDAVILKEYYLSIVQLNHVVNTFIASPQQYPNVFTDGWKSKEQKYTICYKDDISKFIGNNNLETIFQKMYFTQVLNIILDKSEAKYSGWHVGESRGNAEIAVHLENWEREFQFDIAFQAGSFKFAVSRFYWTDKSRENIESVLAWEDDFLALQKEFPGYNRLNKAKTRARISISKNFKVQEREWYLMDRDTLIEAIRHEFETAVIMCKRAIDIHKKRVTLYID